MRVPAWYSAGIAVIRDYLACFSIPYEGIGSPYYVWCLVVDSHVVLIARLIHVPQLPGGGDAKVAPAFQWVV